MARKVYRPTPFGFIFFIISFFILTSLLVWGILYLIFYFVTGHNRYVNIPPLSNLTWEQAVERLDDFDLEARVYDSSNYNPLIPKHQVTTTYPFEGKEVKRGRIVYLTLNPSDYREVILPIILNKTLREAVSILRSLGLHISKLEYIDGKGRDVVAGMRYGGRELTAGDRIKKASKIDLIINKGVQGTMASIPNVIGMDPQAAKDFLHSHSMNLRILKKTSKPSGVVYRQYPKSGTFYPLGKRVDIWVE